MGATIRTVGHQHLRFTIHDLGAVDIHDRNRSSWIAVPSAEIADSRTKIQKSEFFNRELRKLREREQQPDQNHTKTILFLERLKFFTANRRIHESEICLRSKLRRDAWARQYERLQALRGRSGNIQHPTFNAQHSSVRTENGEIQTNRATGYRAWTPLPAPPSARRAGRRNGTSRSHITLKCQRAVTSTPYGS